MKNFLFTLGVMLSTSLYTNLAWGGGSATGNAVTQILPLVYDGEPGFFVKTCPSTGCIVGGAGANPTYFWVAQDNPQYETFLNLATASFHTGTPLNLYGNGQCVPACSNGYERLGHMSASN